MNLDDFITESLLQIHSAVKKANQKLTENYPDEQKKNIFLLKPGAEKNKGEGIHFDLAITVKSETTSKGKFEFSISVVSADFGGKERTNVDEIISRVGFTIHVTKYAGTYLQPPLRK